MTMMIKSLYRNIIGHLIIFAFNVMLALPVWLLMLLAEFFGFIFCVCGFSLKKVAMNNLRLAYGNRKSETEMKAIANESMKNMVRMMFELIVFWKPSYTPRLKEFPIEGEIHLKNAVKKEAGILIIGNHIGNFILLLVALSLKGYRVAYVFKEPKSETFRNHIRRLDTRFNFTLIPMRPRQAAYKKAMETLEQKKIFYTSLDQDKRGNALGVEFFGEKAAMPVGPAVMILKTGATVLPIYMERTGTLQHTIHVLEPMEPHITGDKETDIHHCLKKINERVEKMILANPEEWFWVHRRWKRSHKFSDQ
jgi:KDO2-lipid IV(A) lauroyltransferase